MTPTSKARRGFTLVELLIVIGIIGILSAIVLAALGSARDSANVTKAQAEVRSLRTAIELLVLDTGQWPGHKTVDDVESGGSGNEVWDLNSGAGGLVATDGAFPSWNGPYISVVPVDPWGNPYFFDTDYDIEVGAGETWAAVVGSFGPNGDGQNVYDNDNIYNLLMRE